MGARRALVSTSLAVLLAVPAERIPAGKDVPYVPTPPEVVERMLLLGDVGSGDVVYDLGCGDGRIVIAAVQRPGVRGVCVDLDPVRILESRRNAEAEGVADRVSFVEQDLFEARIEDATVVMLYLLPAVNLKLRPRLLAELRPGTRIVSHAFDMGDWKPERREVVKLPQTHYVIYSWVVPESRRAS